MSFSHQELEEARRRWQYRGQSRPPFAEAPGPGQESVWDFPRPPIVQDVQARLRVLHEGAVLAETDRAKRVIETAGAPTYYFPVEDVQMERLRASQRSSYCEWKGRAAYWTVVGEHGSVPHAVWAYPEPWPGFEPIGGWLAFHPAGLECWIDDERVTPQPGGLYGGWVTTKLAGPIKGAPGTGAW